jgi:hypothetical protein
MNCERNKKSVFIQNNMHKIAHIAQKIANFARDLKKFGLLWNHFNG